ncbi:MAG: response regulator [Bacteroidetes bacterium]|jgi:CheY-like chemotaxis protein|nr:response regulator [Bacteroidota bacterium]
MPSTDRLRPQVLVLEDNPEALLLLRHYLVPHANVTFTSTVDEALAADTAAGPEAYDLYVLDINLGEDRDGVDVLHALQARHGQDHVRALALTAYALPGDRKKFLGAGFTDYLSKPFSREQLMHVLGDAQIVPSGTGRGA